MRIAILQPGYIPWAGFFEQAASVDTFVLFDDVQYTTRDWRSRNKIKTASGWTYLTIPVQHAPQSTLIKDILIDQSSKWQRKHCMTIEQAYAKAPYFKEMWPAIRQGVMSEEARLSVFTGDLIKVMAALIGLDHVTWCYASALDYERRDDPNERMLSICKHLGADLMYQGHAAMSYINHDLFREAGVSLQFQDYQHAPYKQLHGEFIPYLSALDILFNCGGDARHIICSGGQKGDQDGR